MASTSSSAIQKSFKYDVFLSFRGEDTRKNFVDHLYHALNQKGITTYKDDERIKKGERISDQLITSIEESRFYIIVFSKNYASSSWCLDELQKIMECQKTKEQIAYPVFYDVEPTEVRNQSGAVGEAFAKIVAKREKGDGLFSFFKGFTGKRKRMLEDVDMEDEEHVKRWRNALKAASGLAGWELKNTIDGHEAKFIQKIVIDISLKLSFNHWSVDEKLVGMDSRVKNVVTSLATDSNDVRIIGIKGMGGGGKTTLARAVFDHISIQFEGKSFVENVREVSKGSLSGLKELQKCVLKDVLNDQSIDVTSVSDGKYMMKKMICSRKVLVVLDDVDDIDQLEALAGELTWYKPGSRIIITTRDEQVLKAQQVNLIHDVNLLSKEEAICLFSRHAFGREIPIHGFEDLSRKVVQYAAGLPLTIKVLGSHLCGRSEHEWVDAIDRLKTIPLDKTLRRLEISYNGLENDQKEIFLDVVCILKGVKKDTAIRILQSCEFNAQIGLRVLEQKSLITISDYDCLGFHDHIEEMGRNIVRRLNPDDPSRHSRLWIKKEIEDILINESGTEATRSIQLMYSNLHPETIINGLRKLNKLRLLYVGQKNRNLKVDEGSHYLPEALQTLCWNGYPFRSLPKMFQANKLVNLEMCASKISELWEGGERKVLNKLKFLDIRFSNLRTFDLMVTPHLEVLNLEGCKHFIELQLSIVCPTLKVLNLRRSKVSKLNLGMILHLEELNLEGCQDFVELQLPVECPNLKIVNLRGSMVSNLNLGMTPRLEMLNLQGCRNFVELQFPNECPNLKILYLCGSKVSKLNFGLTPQLEVLDLQGCGHFVELQFPAECPNLKVLNLNNCKVSNLNLGRTPYLERLYLRECCCLKEIHAPVGCLKKLVYFSLNHCLIFKYFSVYKQHGLVGLESGDTLNITVSCVDVCPLHPQDKLSGFAFTCKYVEPGPLWSGNLEKLISFGLCACKNLEHFLATISGLQHLRELTLEGGIPPDMWQLESLEKITLRYQEIRHLPYSICMLKHLKSIHLDFCLSLEQLHENICRIDCLEVLRITGSKSLRDIPNSICRLKCLKRLELTFCHNIKKLPDELGSLECLKVLDIEGAGISHLPQSIYQLKGLRIYGSREQLELYGFTSFLTKQILNGCSRYYVKL